MAIRLTESRLRQIIHEEVVGDVNDPSRVRPRFGGVNDPGNKTWERGESERERPANAAREELKIKLIELGEVIMTSSGDPDYAKSVIEQIVDNYFHGEFPASVRRYGNARKAGDIPAGYPGSKYNR